MKVIQELADQYFEIEDQYASKEFNAHIKGYHRKEEFWRNKRELNTHAYFLFLFTRLEDHIRTETTLLVSDKRSNISHWKARAIWDNIDPKKLHFKVLLGLLTVKGGADYIKIVNYYNLRNTIAHGGTVSGISTVINMIDVIDDMNRYFKSLKK